MATDYQSNRPANTLRCGNIKATICQNVNEKGSLCCWGGHWGGRSCN